MLTHGSEILFKKYSKVKSNILQLLVLCFEARYIVTEINTVFPINRFSSRQINGVWKLEENLIYYLCKQQTCALGKLKIKGERRKNKRRQKEKEEEREGERRGERMKNKWREKETEEEREGKEEERE